MCDASVGVWSNYTKNRENVVASCLCARPADTPSEGRDIFTLKEQVQRGKCRNPDVSRLRSGVYCPTEGKSKRSGNLVKTCPDSSSHPADERCEMQTKRSRRQNLYRLYAAEPGRGGGRLGTGQVGDGEGRGRVLRACRVSSTPDWGAGDWSAWAVTSASL